VFQSLGSNLDLEMLIPTHLVGYLKSPEVVGYHNYWTRLLMSVDLATSNPKTKEEELGR